MGEGEGEESGFREEESLGEEDDFLFLRYIPAAQLVHINKKWRTSKEEGFLIGMRSGMWKKESVLEQDGMAAPVGNLDLRFIGMLQKEHVLTLDFPQSLDSHAGCARHRFPAKLVPPRRSEPRRFLRRTAPMR